MKRIICYKYLISVSFFLLIVIGSTSTFAQVTLDGSISYNTGTGSSLTMSHTTGVGTNRLMLVGVSWNGGLTNRTISSVTFTPSGGGDASSLSLIIEETVSTTRHSAIYSLENPPSNQSGSVIITFSGNVSSGIVAGVANFKGVDQLNPLGKKLGANDYSTTPSVTLNELNGNELVFDNVFIGVNNCNTTVSPGDSQTSLWNGCQSSALSASSTEQATGSSVTMSWQKSGGNSANWIIVAVAINPEPNSWLGSTDEDWYNVDNWSQGLPSSITNVIIPFPSEYYPEISGTSTANCKNLTVESGASLTILPGGRANIAGNIAVESGADFTIQSTSAGEGMLIFDSGTQTGDINVELFLLGGENRYHYFTPPVKDMDIGTSVASATTNLGLTSFNGDLVLYDGNEASNSMEEGWQYFDGYGTTNAFSSLSSSRGYNIWLPSNGTIKFNGQLNSSSHSFNIAYVSSTLDYSGWNLVGNPYPVNYDLRGISALSSIEEDDIANTIYFTNNGDFASINISTGIGSSGTSPIIRPMQGFFVFATQEGSLSLPTGYKTLDPAQQRFKGEGTNEDSKESPYKMTRLTLTSGSVTDETLILLVEGSSYEFNETYDGFKLFSSSDPAKPFIYSKLNGVNYFMKAVASPESNPVIVPLEVIIKESGDHSIKVTEFENLKGYNVILKHGNVEVPLANGSDYTINLAPGTYSDFELRFEKISTDVKSEELSDLKTWYNNNYIYINFPSNIQPEKGKLTIFDFYGKQVYRDNNLQVVPEQTIQIPVNLRKGLYFIDLNVDFRHFRSKTVAN